MKKIIRLFFCLTCLVLLFNSCKKTPGQGGNAQIKGKVWTEDWDDPFFTYISHEYPSANQTVYLYFGNDASPGTSVKTNDNGEFEFKYLRKGDYKIVVWSKAKQNSSNLNDPKTIAVEAKVTLAKRRDVKDVGTLTIKD
jgi:hypothetical protein